MVSVGCYPADKRWFIFEMEGVTLTAQLRDRGQQRFKRVQEVAPPKAQLWKGCEGAEVKAAREAREGDKAATAQAVDAAPSAAPTTTTSEERAAKVAKVQAALDELDQERKANRERSPRRGPTGTGGSASSAAASREQSADSARTAESGADALMKPSTKQVLEFTADDAPPKVGRVEPPKGTKSIAVPDMGNCVFEASALNASTSP